MNRLRKPEIDILMTSLVSEAQVFHLQCHKKLLHSADNKVRFSKNHPR